MNSDVDRDVAGIKERVYHFKFNIDHLDTKINVLINNSSPGRVNIKYMVDGKVKESENFSYDPGDEEYVSKMVIGIKEAECVNVSVGFSSEQLLPEGAMPPRRMRRRYRTAGIVGAVAALLLIAKPVGNFAYRCIDNYLKVEEAKMSKSDAKRFQMHSGFYTNAAVTNKPLEGIVK